eukprot:scaffold1216_cov357-Prasinococcus_capsulatus_cf.AAC.4
MLWEAQRCLLALLAVDLHVCLSLNATTAYCSDREGERRYQSSRVCPDMRPEECVPAKPGTLRHGAAAYSDIDAP